MLCEAVCCKSPKKAEDFEGSKVLEDLLGTMEPFSASTLDHAMIMALEHFRLQGHDITDPFVYVKVIWLDKPPEPDFGVCSSVMFMATCTLPIRDSALMPTMFNFRR